MKFKKKSGVIILIAMMIAIVSLFVACTVGAADIEISDVWNVFGYKAGFKKEVESSAYYIIWGLRLPRAITAIFIGGGLAVAGAVMQSVTKNVMADSYILGISSGALAFVSVGAFILGQSISVGWSSSLLAFAGALFSVFLVLAIGGTKGTMSSTRIVLVGQAISITLNAVAQYFIYTSVSGNKSSSIVTWMMGSLAGVRWNNMWVTVIGIFLCSGITFYLSRAYDLMALGDDTAITLGVNVNRMKRISLILVALITGFAVASSGIIGLVGFMIPHVVRAFVGSVHHRVFPISFILGGVFLMWMDVLARTILDPQEVPIGIFTALCGGPFFLWVLRKQVKGGA
ncbi:MAG: iron ABC transporter permease [Lachnospiraceae bacterium]|nr:iron ABC transporter permease [Lachnospiraceae bacterium]